jgi:type I restriction enzyme M protein
MRSAIRNSKVNYVETMKQIERIEQVASIEQTELFAPDRPTVSDLPELFKRIYIHLYTNSKASRAELIIEDLSLLLLAKLAETSPNGELALSQYIEGTATANKVLIPLLRAVYPELIDQDQTFSLEDTALRSALREMQEVSLLDAPAHILGEAFQALIGPRLRGERGQFFTPRSLVRAMVSIIDPGPTESVLDPACGTGGFLAETHIYQAARYAGKRYTGQIVGVEKDRGLSRLATALLRVLCGTRSKVGGFNSLNECDWKEHFDQTFESSFDVVMTNPPFGAKIGVEDPLILSRFDFGHLWSTPDSPGGSSKQKSIAESQDPQMLFLELCARALKPNGRLAIVLPEGMFGNRGTSFIWKWLRERGEIFALIDCPRTTFQPGTDTKTNVLFWRKSAAVKRKPKRGPSESRPLISVSVHCGHDRRGRSMRIDNTPYPDDFPLLATQFHLPQSKRELWRALDIGDCEYVVPRYHFAKGDAGTLREPIAAGAKMATLGRLQEDGILAIRKGHEVGSEAYGSGDVPFVRTSDLSNFEVSNDPTKCVNDDIYTEYAPQQKLKAGDVLMAVDGRYRIGATAILHEHNRRCIVQSHIRILSTLDADQLDPYELLFALSLESVKSRIRSLVFVQSTLGTLGARLLELEIPLLHGSGPWTDRVGKFRSTLQKRAALLADINSVGGSEVEL